MTGAALALLHVFPTFAIDGVPVRIAEMLNRIGKGYRHTVLAMDGVLDCRSRLDPDLDVALFPAQVLKGNPVAALPVIRAELRRQRPDVLLTYIWGAIECGVANRFGLAVRHIHFESGFGPKEADRQIFRRALFRRWALAEAEALVVPSRTLVRIATEVWKVDPGKVHYFSNSVDVARFAITPDPAALPVLLSCAGERVVGLFAPLRTENTLGACCAPLRRCRPKPVFGSS